MSDFPQPQCKDGGKPCGECHIQPAETCDICGAVGRPDVTLAVLDDMDNERARMKDMLEGSRTAHVKDLRELRKCQVEIEEARIILAAWDINSLPKDMSLKEICEARIADLQKFMNRAEAAETEIERLRERLGYNNGRRE